MVTIAGSTHPPVKVAKKLPPRLLTVFTSKTTSALAPLSSR